jgi:hypothetical protein
MALSYSLFVWLISHQPAVLFSQTKPAISNQPTVLFSQNKSAPAISHQPNEQAGCQVHWVKRTLNFFKKVFLYFIYLFIYNVTSTFCLRSKPFNENINYRKFIIGTAFTLL